MVIIRLHFFTFHKTIPTSGVEAGAPDNRAGAAGAAGQRCELVTHTTKTHSVSSDGIKTIYK